MNGWITGGVLYAVGALITCLWVARAIHRNSVLRGRYEEIALLVGWPLVALSTAVSWPVIVVMVTVFGEPGEKESSDD